MLPRLCSASETFFIAIYRLQRRWNNSKQNHVARPAITENNSKVSNESRLPCGDHALDLFAETKNSHKGGCVLSCVPISARCIKRCSCSYYFISSKPSEHSILQQRQALQPFFNHPNPLRPIQPSKWPCTSPSREAAPSSAETPSRVAASSSAQTPSRVAASSRRVIPSKARAAPSCR
jgi:hypothetical protein